MQYLISKHQSSITLCVEIDALFMTASKIFSDHPDHHWPV
jgi:hypothetical protein